MQYQTFLIAEVPRVPCLEDGVHPCPVPSAEDRGRLMALFEVPVVDLLQEASIDAVSRHMKLSLDELAGIQERAVRRGL